MSIAAGTTDNLNIITLKLEKVVLYMFSVWFVLFYNFFYCEITQQAFEHTVAAFVSSG